MSTKRSIQRSFATKLLSCTVSLLAAACAADGEAEFAVEQDALDDSTPSSLLGENAVEFVEVRANGGGCPAGTWKAELAPDKLSFNVSLASYSVELAPTTSSTIASKNCTFTVRMKGNVSYAVQSYTVQARAALDEGVRASAFAEARLVGNQASFASTRKDIAGPYDDVFTVTHAPAELSWSTCGSQSLVALNSRLVLQGTNGATGALQVASLGGALPASRNAEAFGIRFAVRSCDGKPVPTLATAPPVITQPTSAGGVAIADITAYGTGCPAGTWVAESAPDGSPSGVRFVGFAAQVAPNTSVAVKDCVVSITPKMEVGRSFAVQSATYSGTASLSGGATAQLTTKYAFQGSASSTSEASKSFIDGLAANYEFRDEITPERALWSECGVQRNVNITSRVRVLGNGGAGTVSVGQLSGLQFVTRPCSNI